MVIQPSYDPRYLKFVELFNRQRFFEAHEVLEILWREETRPVRDFYHGLIQFAAACVHLQKGTPDGARKLVSSASEYLKPYQPSFAGIDLQQLKKGVETAIEDKAPYPVISLTQT